MNTDLTLYYLAIGLSFLCLVQGALMFFAVIYTYLYKNKPNRSYLTVPQASIHIGFGFTNLIMGGWSLWYLDTSLIRSSIVLTLIILSGILNFISRKLWLHENL